MKFLILNCHIVILLLTLLNSCSEQKAEQDKIENGFNLKDDIYDFSNKLHENDTLTLIVQSSVCTSSSMDSILFIKRNNRVNIKTTSYDWTFGEKVYPFEQQTYSKSKDSLNFEDLFKYVKNKSVKNNELNSAVFTLYYKSETLSFYSSSLIDLMKYLGYFYDIQNRLYPNMDPYKPVYPPVSE